MKWILYILGLGYWIMFQPNEGSKIYYVGDSRWVDDISKAKRFKTNPATDHKYFAYWHQSELVNKINVRLNPTKTNT